MTARGGLRHTLTHDSCGHALPQPVEIDIRAQAGALALVHSDAQGELVTVHLEVDAAATWCCAPGTARPRTVSRW